MIGRSIVDQPMTSHLMVEIRSCEGVDGVQVDVHVVIRLDNKLGLLAELGDPQLAEHALVGEVAVGVGEVASHKITMFTAFAQELKTENKFCLPQLFNPKILLPLLVRTHFADFPGERRASC